MDPSTKPAFSVVPFLARPQSHIIPTLLDFAKKIGIRVDIVNITGGPAGAKTTMLTRVEFECYQRGILPIMVPEAATIVRNMGFKAERSIAIDGVARPIVSNYMAQSLMLDINESTFVYALTYAIQSAYEGGYKHIVLFRDRTGIDAAGYMPLAEFEAMLREKGLNVGDLAPGLTILLNSLAVDDPDLYLEVCGSNPARFETPAQAVAANANMIRVYTYFGINPVIIRNGPDGLEGKMARGMAEVFQFIGLPRIQKQSVVFVCATEQDLLHDLGFTDKRPIRITQFYDVDGTRYRETSFPLGSVVYTRTIKSAAGEKGVYFYDTERISSDEYFSARRRLGANLQESAKRRYVGISTCPPGGDSQFIKVDVYDNGLIGDLIRVEFDVVDDLCLPRCISSRQHRNVTGVLGLSDADIAQGRFANPL